MRVCAIVLEHHYRGFTEEALMSALSQDPRPWRVLLSTGDARKYDVPGVEVRRLETESEGERLRDAVEACQGADAYALLEDDDVWLEGHLARAERFLAMGRTFYESATTSQGSPIGFNLSSMAFSAGLDLSKVARYPTMVDTALVVAAVEQDFVVVLDPAATVYRRVHGSNISIYRGWWAVLKDRMLQQLKADFPAGRAGELADMFFKRLYGSLTPYQARELAEGRA